PNRRCPQASGWPMSIASGVPVTALHSAADLPTLTAQAAPVTKAAEEWCRVSPTGRTRPSPAPCCQASRKLVREHVIVPANADAHTERSSLTADSCPDTEVALSRRVES